MNVRFLLTGTSFIVIYSTHYNYIIRYGAVLSNAIWFVIKILTGTIILSTTYIFTLRGGALQKYAMTTDEQNVDIRKISSTCPP